MLDQNTQVTELHINGSSDMQGYVRLVRKLEINCTTNRTKLLEFGYVRTKMFGKNKTVRLHGIFIFFGNKPRVRLHGSFNIFLRNNRTHVFGSEKLTRDNRTVL